MSVISPQSGQISRFKFIAINWSESPSFFEAQGIKKRNLYRLRQELKNKHPEILERNNPLMASVLLA